MYTQCPKCQTMFRVSAQQLRAAAGRVRCSQCNGIFDALSHRAAWENEGAAKDTPPLSSPEPNLPAPEQSETPETGAQAGNPRPETAPPSSAEGLDAPQLQPERPTPVQPEAAVRPSEIEQVSPGEETAKPEPRPTQSRAAASIAKGGEADGKGRDAGMDWDPFTEENIEALLRPTEGEPEPPVPSPRAATEAGSADRRTSQKAARFQVEESERPQPKKARQPRSKAEPKPEPPKRNERLDAPSSAGSIETPIAEEDDPELPLQLQNRPDRRSGIGATLVWSLGVLLVLSTLGGQYAYFNRDHLALQPQWRPYLEQLCKAAGCELPPRRDSAFIELTDHAVQSHPRRNGALLITATLLNEAEFPQPYPDVEIVMMDVEQRPVASRRFPPDEYITGQSPDGLFAAGQEAHLMLEVVDPGPQAVSFEFDFH